MMDFSLYEDEKCQPVPFIGYLPITEVQYIHITVTIKSIPDELLDFLATAGFLEYNVYSNDLWTVTPTVNENSL